MGENIGSLGFVAFVMWFAYTFQVFEWWVIVLALIGLGTVTYPAFRNEREKNLKAQTAKLEAETAYFRFLASGQKRL